MHSIYRSLAVFPWKDWEFSLGNTLMGATQEFSGSEFDNGFSMFEIGLNVANPWRFTLFKRKIRVDTFFIYTEFLDDLDFLFANGRREEISRLYQLGAVLRPDKEYSIWFIKLKGIGLSFLFGGDVRAIRLHTGFPF